MDVYIWLLCCKSIGKADLERIGNYVIGNKEECGDFEQFRTSAVYGNIFIREAFGSASHSFPIFSLDVTEVRSG